jgi:autotransporter-associated beta strand protein
MPKHPIFRNMPSAAFAAASLAFAAQSGASAQTFNLNGTSQAVESLDGFSLVTNSGNPATLTIGPKGTSSTFAGTVQDGLGTVGVIKAGTGALTLTGVNTQTGDVRGAFPGFILGVGPISLAATGGTLAINSGAALGGTAVAISDATLASTGGAPVTIANRILIGLAPGASATFDTSGGDIHVASAISGLTSAVAAIPLDGGLIKTGAGTLFLESATGNSFGGGVQLQQGTIAIARASELGLPVGIDALTFFPGGTLRTTADINGGFEGAMVLGCVAGVCGNANFAPDAGTTLTIDTAIDGSARLRMTGAGTLVLTGAKAFTGGVLVSSGVLAVDDATAINAGGIDLENGARLRLLAALDFTPPTFTLNGAGIVDTNGFGATIGTAIVDGASAGLLIKDGAGTLLLNAASTFSGGTEVRGGTLALGVANALNPLTGVTVDSGATLSLGGHALTLASLGGSGTVAGDGRLGSQLILGATGASFGFGGSLVDGTGRLTLVKQGAGTLTLTGANSFSGGIDLLGGTIVAGSASALGAGAISMDDGTTLAFSVASMTVANAVTFTGVTDPTINTGAGTITFSNTISGPGALTKTGSGTLILTGASNYTGATNVAQGVLEVDGSIISPVTISSGAILSGVGTVGGVNALAGATVAPGNAAQPYGVLRSSGNIAFAPGSIYAVNMSSAGSSLLATRGTASLAGGLVVATWTGAAPTIGSRYAILTAAGGVTGGFAAVSASGTGSLLPLLAYDSNNVYLAFTGLTRQVVQTSFQNQADGRLGALVTWQVLTGILDGLNEQINCSSCVSAFGAIGSFSAGVHGRYAINNDLAFFGGAAFAQYHSGDVNVTSSPIFLAALRYDKVEWGASRPFAELGAAASPWQNVTYSRSYFDGVAARLGRGAADDQSYEIFGKAGWVTRWTPIDEASAYVGLSRVWQNAGGFVETSLNNSSPANILPGVDAINVARVGAQWTHLFAARFETQINIALAQSFGSQGGVSGSVLGANAISASFGDMTWAEYGLRVGYRVADGLVADIFADGTLGAEPIGATIHGGVGLRYAF